MVADLVTEEQKEGFTLVALRSWKLSKMGPMVDPVINEIWELVGRILSMNSWPVLIPLHPLICHSLSSAKSFGAYRPIGVLWDASHNSKHEISSELNKNLSSSTLQLLLIVKMKLFVDSSHIYSLYFHLSLYWQTWAECKPSY